MKVLHWITIQRWRLTSLQMLQEGLATLHNKTPLGACAELQRSFGGKPMMSSDWAAVITLTASFFTVFVAGISVGYKIGKSQKK